MKMFSVFIITTMLMASVGGAVIYSCNFQNPLDWSMVDGEGAFEVGGLISTDGLVMYATDITPFYTYGALLQLKTSSSNAFYSVYLWNDEANEWVYIIEDETGAGEFNVKLQTEFVTDKVAIEVKDGSVDFESLTIFSYNPIPLEEIDKIYQNVVGQYAPWLIPVGAGVLACFMVILAASEVEPSKKRRRKI